jgi:hypothetical protein
VCCFRRAWEKLPGEYLYTTTALHPTIELLALNVHIGHSETLKIKHTLNTFLTLEFNPFFRGTETPWPDPNPSYRFRFHLARHIL